MSNYATMLLSKAIDEQDVSIFPKHNIETSLFKSKSDRQAFEFICDYKLKTGEMPSYAVVMENVPGFIYFAEVSDSFDYLTKRLRNDAGLIDFANVIQEDVQLLVDDHKNDMPTLLCKLTDKLDEIKKRTESQEQIGVSLKANKDRFLEEYGYRKDGKSFKVWRSKFSNIKEYVSGNMYVIYGKSGRGKSVVAAVEEALEMALQGAKVLIWSMEMPWFEVFVRLYVALSGRKGLTTVSVAGVDLSAGFDSNSLRNGQLGEDFEAAFRIFLANLNDELPGEIIVRGVDDRDFTDRSLRQLESDITNVEADVVVLDPFYYMDYERNVSGTTGGAAAQTSMMLRRLVGRLDVVCLAITQADEGKTIRDENEQRELKVPEREDVTKTKQLMQDATLLIGVDTDYKQGRGLIGINKGRNGGEGEVVEMIYAPQYGVVSEIKIDEFEDIF